MKKSSSLNGAPAERIVITQRGNLHANITTAPVIRKLAERAFTLYIRELKKLGLPRQINSGRLGRMTDPSSIAYHFWHELKLNTVALGMGFDSITSQHWVNRVQLHYLKVLFKETGGTIGGVEFSEDAYVKARRINLTEMLEAFYDLFTEIQANAYHSDQNNRCVEYLHFIHVTRNGECTLPDDFSSQIHEHLCLYANEKQTAFYHEVEKILSRLNQIETEYHTPGLFLQGTIRNGHGYQFNVETLTRI